MKGVKDPPKLTRPEQLQVCVWLAELHTPSEVIRLIEDNFSKHIAWGSVNRYSLSPRWKRVIDFLRNRINADLTKIPIANKSTRLRRLENIYQQAMTETLKSISQYGRVYEFKLSSAINALIEARKEIDGEKPLIDASTHYHYTNIADDKLIAEANSRGVVIPEAIRGRVVNAEEVVDAPAEKVAD